MSTKSARRSKGACAEEKAQVRLENLLEIAKENVNKKIFERLSAYVVELMKEYKETKKLDFLKVRESTQGQYMKPIKLIFQAWGKREDYPAIIIRLIKYLDHGEKGEKVEMKDKILTQIQRFDK